MKKENKPLSKLKIFFQSNILFQKWTKRSLSLFLFAIPFVVLIIHSCTKQFESSEGLGTPVLNVNQLDSNVAIHLSYEAETLKFSEIVDDKESFKGSEGLNKMAKIPSVERIKYETSIYKDGNFKTLINIIEPFQKIEGIKSLSPPNTDKEIESAKKFEITPTTMTAYYADGSVKFTQAVNFPTYKYLLNKLKEPCFKNNAQAALSILGIFNVKGDYYLSDCYQSEIKKLNGSIKKSEDGKYTIIRKPMMSDVLKENDFNKNLNLKGKTSLMKGKVKYSEAIQFLCKMILENNKHFTLDQINSLYKNKLKNRNIQNLSSYGIYANLKDLHQKHSFEILLTSNEDTESLLRKDNLERALEGNNPNNFDDVTIVDNESKKVIGKAIYEGEEKMVMSQRYQLKEGSDNIEVINNEFYIIDPITNTSRTDIVQTQYSNVNFLTNL